MSIKPPQNNILGDTSRPPLDVEQLLRDYEKSKKALREALDEQGRLAHENSRYRSRFGCLGCGEIHHGDCCPPGECRTKGIAWYSTTQAINRYHAMERRIDEMCAAPKRELVPVYSGPDLRIGDRVFLHNGHEVEVYGFSEESGVRTSGGIFRLSALYRKFESGERNDHDLRKLQAETALYHQYARAIAEARELLRLVEWWGPYLNSAWKFCPACGALRHDGHSSDCKLAAWLRGERVSTLITVSRKEYARLLRAEAREREHQVAFSPMLARLNVLAGYLGGSVGGWDEPQARQTMYTHASEMSGQVDRFMAQHIKDEEESRDEFVPR